MYYPCSEHKCSDQRLRNASSFSHNMQIVSFLMRCLFFSTPGQTGQTKARLLGNVTEIWDEYKFQTKIEQTCRRFATLET